MGYSVSRPDTNGFIHLKEIEYKSWVEFSILRHIFVLSQERILCSCRATVRKWL